MRASQHEFLGDGLRARAYLGERQQRNLALIRQIDLLGEFNTTADELDPLGREIAGLVRTVTPGIATKWLASEYPLALGEFLVAVGVYDYRPGDFWIPCRSGQVPSP